MPALKFFDGTTWNTVGDLGLLARLAQQEQQAQ